MAVTWNATSPTAGGTPYLALSNGGLTATVSPGAADQVQVIASASFSTGKWFWSLLIGAGSSAWSMGLQDGAEGSWTGSSTHSIGTVPSDGAIWHNFGYFGAGVGAAIVTGDVIDFAVDVDAGKIWFRRNGGLWNSDSLADPATGVGGITGWTITKPWFPCVNIYQTGAVTVNFGATAFTYAKPTGFSAVDTGSGAVTGLGTAAGAATTGAEGRRAVRGDGTAPGAATTAATAIRTVRGVGTAPGVATTAAAASKVARGDGTATAAATTAAQASRAVLGLGTAAGAATVAADGAASAPVLPAPAERTIVLSAENRLQIVDTDPRLMLVAAEPVIVVPADVRTQVVDADPRALAVPAETRTMTA